MKKKKKKGVSLSSKSGQPLFASTVSDKRACFVAFHFRSENKNGGG